MATNANIASGLKPVNNNAGAWTGQGRLIAFASSYASNVFIGDPLVPSGVTDANGVPYCTLATAGATNTVLGSFLGITNGPAGGGANGQSPLLQSSTLYRQASVLTYGFVTDDPNQLFEIQEDSSGGAIAAANAGYANGNLVSGSGSTATGLSGWQLQSSSVGSGNATYQLRVLELLRGPDNVLGTNAKWLVRLNLPALWATTGY